MRFLATADVHAHNFSQFSARTADGYNTRLMDAINVLRQFAKSCRDLQVDYGAILGDLFHSRTKLDIDVLAMVHETVCEIAESCRERLLLLVGNHDQHNLVGDVHSMIPFRKANKISVIDVPITINLQGVRVAMHPFTKNIEELTNWCRAQVPVDLLCIHQGMREAALGPFDARGVGDLSVNDLPLDGIKHFVLVGDYHKRQLLAGGKVQYVGSPRQQDFGEVGDHKAFTFIDSAEWILRDVPTYAPKFFEFDLAVDLEAAIDRGLVNPVIDYIKIHEDKLPPNAGMTGRIQFVPVQEEKTAIQRVGSEVVGNDYLLLQEYVRQRGGGDESLLRLGADLLMGDE